MIAGKAWGGGGRDLLVAASRAAVSTSRRRLIAAASEQIVWFVARGPSSRATIIQGKSYVAGERCSVGSNIASNWKGIHKRLFAGKVPVIRKETNDVRTVSRLVGLRDASWECSGRSVMSSGVHPDDESFNENEGLRVEQWKRIWGEISEKKIRDLDRRMRVLDLKKEDIHEEFVRGSGRGGQKVNKTANKVRLTHTPSGEQAESHQERERSKNRFLAMRILVEKLEKLRGVNNNAKSKSDLIREKIRKGKARSRRNSKNRADGDEETIIDEEASITNENVMIGEKTFVCHTEAVTNKETREDKIFDLFLVMLQDESSCAKGS